MSEHRRRKPMKPRIRLREQFIPHLATMLTSDVFRSLRLTDLRILQRLEIEHVSHGGKQNGDLTCTYSDFVEYGMRRASIPEGIRRLVRRRIPRRHGARPAELRRPAHPLTLSCHLPAHVRGWTVG